VDGRVKPGHDEAIQDEGTPKTLAPASGWGTTLEDRRASLEAGDLLSDAAAFVGYNFVMTHHELRSRPSEYQSSRTPEVPRDIPPIANDPHRRIAAPAAMVSAM
jgi:hypothetical protein